MDREHLSSLSRTQLQALAKKNNIKANLKSEDIVINLSELNGSTDTRSRSASEYLVQSKARTSTTAAVASQKRSTTQPDLSTARLRLHSIVLPAKSSNHSRSIKNEAKKPIVVMGYDTEPEGEEVTELGPSTRSKAKVDVFPASPTKKAKETQKRLGVGRPVIVGGTGARKSTAKGKVRQNVAEVVLPLRKVDEESETKRVYQPLSSPTAPGTSGSRRDGSSPSKAQLSALRTSLADLDQRMDRMESVLAGERRKVTNLEGQVVNLKDSLKKARNELVKAQESTERAHEKIAQLESLVTTQRESLEQNGLPRKEDEVFEDMEVVRSTPDQPPLSAESSADKQENHSKSSSPFPPTPPSPSNQQRPVSIPPVDIVASSSISQPADGDALLPPSRLGKRSREPDESMGSDASAALPKSPNKKLRLDAPISQNDVDVEMESQDQAPSISVVDPKGKKRALSLVPPSHPPRQATSVPPISTLHRSVIVASSLIDPSQPSSTTITASANHVENQRSLRSQSVGPSSGLATRGLQSLMPSAARSGLTTITEAEGASKTRKLSASRTKGKTERTWAVGRFSTEGTPLNPTKSSAIEPSTAGASSSTLFSKDPVDNEPAPLPSNDASPTHGKKDSRSMIHLPDEPVRPLVPLSTLDTGNEFYGTESKRQYQNEWHTGIVFDDAFSAEGAQQYASVIAREDMIGKSSSHDEEMELEPLPAPLNMDAIDMGHNFIPGVGMDVFTEPGSVSEL